MGWNETYIEHGGMIVSQIMAPVTAEESNMQVPVQRREGLTLTLTLTLMGGSGRDPRGERS